MDIALNAHHAANSPHADMVSTIYQVVAEIRSRHHIADQSIAANHASDTPEEPRISSDYAFYALQDFDTDNVEEFILNAYRKILRREADPGGLAAYSQAMANGASKSQVLEALLLSDEHKDRGAPTIVFEITPVAEAFKALLSQVRDVSENVRMLEHRLQSLQGL